MQTFDEIKANQLYVATCKMNNSEKEIARKNPHCAEFFCTLKNVMNCSSCLNQLMKNKKFKLNSQKTKEFSDIRNN